MQRKTFSSWTRLFGSLLLLLANISCIRPVDWDHALSPKQLVISCFPEPGKPIKVFLRYSGPIVSGGENSSPCYQAVIFKVKDSVVYSRAASCDSVLNFEARIEPGDILRLEITTTDGLIAATDTVPTSHFDVFDGMAWRVPNGEGGYRGFASFAMRDRDAQHDFYAFQSLFYSSSDGLGVADVLASNAPALSQEGDIEYRSTTWPLSDLYFNQDTVELTYEVVSGRTGGQAANYEIPAYLLNQQHPQDIFNRFWAVSPTHYRFLKSWIRHQHNRQTGNYRSDDVIEVITRGEPSLLYSNVEGGLGIFAARSAPVYLKLEER